MSDISKDFRHVRRLQSVEVGLFSLFFEFRIIQIVMETYKKLNSYYKENKFEML